MDIYVDCIEIKIDTEVARVAWCVSGQVFRGVELFVLTFLKALVIDFNRKF